LTVSAVPPADIGREISDVGWVSSVSHASGASDTRSGEHIRQYGWDAKLTDLLPALVADCPTRGSVGVYDRCKAVYERRG
jgi:hypothetical protein